MGKLSVSILSSDFLNLKDTIAAIEEGSADYLHMDIMDGHFVPNISYGPSITGNISAGSAMPLDIHLMIENPDRYIDDFLFKNTEYIVVHEEASRHLHRTISRIKMKGFKAGVALNPATPVETLDVILGELDLVLIMSVNPGFGGQSFIESTFDKVRKLDGMRKNRKLDFKIEVDGGVNKENVVALKEAGVDIFVVGSAITKHENISEITKEFIDIIK